MEANAVLHKGNNCWNSTQSKRIPGEGSSLHSRLLLGHQTIPPTLLYCSAVPTGAGQGHMGLVVVVTDSLFLSSLWLCWSLELCHHQPPEHCCWRVDDVSRVSFHFPAGREVLLTRPTEGGKAALLGQWMGVKHPSGPGNCQILLHQAG